MNDRRTSAGNLGPDSGLIGPGWGWGWGDCSQSSYQLCSVFRGGRSEYPFYTAYPLGARRCCYRDPDEVLSPMDMNGSEECVN